MDNLQERWRMVQLNQIAQVEKLLNKEEIVPFQEILSRPVVADIVKAEVDLYRQKIIQQSLTVDLDELVQNIVRTLDTQCIHRTHPVINATGVVVHTNLGRSPLPPVVWQEAQAIMCHYTNLEINLVNGKRGNRMGSLNKILSLYFGGESNLIVNNNAAAMHLILKAFAEGKEVVVSRGEQVQIGGGFRIPEILKESGAILRDVGTTNITTLNDYLEAINENTAMVLVVHQSNYYIEGFTQHVDVQALASNLPEHVMLVVDQGSGNQTTNIPGEPTISSYLKSGADLICFSGDKMLGGPQAGIILGKKSYIDKLAKHPMMRVFRPGKETYVLLEKLLIHRLNRDGKADNRIEMLISQPLSWHKERAQQLVDIAPHKLSLVSSKFLVGGGTTPRAQYDTWAVTLDSQHSASNLLKMLRHQSPPILGVIQQDKVLLYPVAMFDDELPIVKNILKKILLKDDFN